MHMLLLTHYFPPGLEVGGVRPARLAEALLTAGHRVTVVTAALPGELPGVRLADGDLTVITVVSPTPVRLLLARLKFWRRHAPSPGTAPVAPGASQGEGPRSRLRRWILSLLWTPDDRHRFIGRARRAVLKVHHRQPVDVLYSSGPPFSVHLAGRQVARAAGVPWVAELRDPWTDVPRDTGRRSAASDWIEAHLERRVLRAASGVIAVTPTVAGWLTAKRRALGHSDAVLVAYNGVPTIAPAPGPAADAPIEILHAGTLYLRRDPRPLLAALAQALTNGALGARPVRISFLGAHGKAYNGVSVVDMARAVGLDHMVQVEGHLPTEACQARMASATALLLLAQDQPAQVPNKLFDYLAARRPVIAVADADGEVATLLHQVGGHQVLDQSAPDFPHRLAAAVVEAAATPSTRWDGNAALAALSVPQQYARIVELMESVAATGSGR